MNDIAIIILNYNSWNATLEEVEICYNLFNVCWKNIIVIDNKSTNESSLQLKTASTNRFVFIEAERNGGYAAGNNIGLRYAIEKGFKYALILNNDIIIKDKCLLKKMKDVLKKDNALAVVNPDIYAPNGYLFNRDSKRPSFWDMTLGMIAYRKKGRKIENLGGYGYVYRPQGCCMLISLEKIKEVNFLDEQTFLYSEEIILAERLIQKGYKCACCIETCIVHDHSNTVKNVFDKHKILNIKAGSYKYYLYKYRGFRGLKLVLALFFYKMKLIILEGA